MRRQKRLERLRSLRGEIAALCAVKCRMSHERVVRAGESMLPVASRLPGGGYERVGLCSPGARAQRLGCSHTTARVKLKDAINELRACREGAGPGALFDGELNWLDNQIHLLDHRKGEAEKALARLLEEAHGARDDGRKAEKLAEAENGPREMERLHCEYVGRLSLLRDAVAAEMGGLLEQAEPIRPG